jgi:NAD(P)H-hydrate epimerase
VIPVVTPEAMRTIDAASGEPVEVLIERAGAAVASLARRLLGGEYGRRVAVVAGPGNNGADGRVAAEHLRARGIVVTVFDALDLPADVADRLRRTDLVIDAAFGTGFRGGWTFPPVGDVPVLAVDVPTGLDAATGAAADGTRRALATVTFQAAKPGHYLNDGPDHVGDLHVVDIGLDLHSAGGDVRARVVEPVDIASLLPRRARDSHKWRQAVRIVAGSAGMTGAAHLAAAAAQRAGASLVALSSPGIQAVPPVEAIERRVPAFDWDAAVLADLHRFRALVIGPGLGREGHTVPSVVRTVTESIVPVVVDGDGLFALSWNDAGHPGFLAEREVATVLTPHDGEFQTMMGARPGPDRIGAAISLAEITTSTVLLKGPTTIVAAPGEVPALVCTGDERLATAGTGDVLAGLIGALLAQGLRPFDAAVAGAVVHGLAARRCPEPGVVAGDLIPEIPNVIGALR